jgi:hypothetical protein
MITLTPIKLKNYVQDYDYVITIQQAKDILDLLEQIYGTFYSEDIQMATDYIIYGNKSMYVSYFE